MKKLLQYAALCTAGILLTACPGYRNSEALPVTPEYEVIPVQEMDAEDFTRSQNQFMMELYRQIYHSDQNVFFSPISLTSALGMTYMGAYGDTAQEMAQVLNIAWEKEEYAQQTRLFIEHLNALNQLDGIDMLMANAAWGKKGYPFQKEYLETLETNFFAHYEPVDFTASPTEAVNIINSWVADKTRQKITQLLSERSLSPLTRLVLTNAVYFYGLWEFPFKPEATRERAFTLASGAEVQTSFMHQTEDFPYMETEDFQMLQLPYQGEGLAMVIVLPKEEASIRDVEQALSWNELETHMESLSLQKVRTVIPRFTIRSNYAVRPLLEDMGMKKAFIPGEADLRGIDGGESKDLHISAIVHQAFVEVTEKGTEAAAATGIVVGVTSYMPPKVFQADRPFLFFIRDLQTGSVLFWGRLMNPQA